MSDRGGEVWGDVKEGVARAVRELYPDARSTEEAFGRAIGSMIAGRIAAAIYKRRGAPGWAAYGIVGITQWQMAIMRQLVALNAKQQMPNIYTSSSVMGGPKR
jgi:hypothetical protein